MLSLGRKRVASRHPPSPLLLGATGGLGSLFCLIGASQAASPFAEHSGGSWFFSLQLARAGDGLESGVLLVYAGLAVLVCSWLGLLLESKTLSPHQLFGIVASWSFPLVFIAPLFSHDAYSYLAQAEMVSRGLSPYHQGASSLPPGPFLAHVDPIWRHAVTPYGPGWLRLVQGLLFIAGHHLLGALALLRVVALVSYAAIVWGVFVIAREIGLSPTEAVAFGVANPLVLLTTLGGLHNDSLMLAFVVGGVALAVRGRFLAGSLLCALGAEVKAPAFLGVVFIACWASSKRSTARRLLTVAGHLVGTGVVVFLLDLATGLGSSWVRAAFTPGKVVSWLDPATAVGLGLSHLLSALGAGAHRAAALAGARALFLLGAAVFSALLAWRSDIRSGPGRLGAGYLAFALLGPIIWPWYESWGMCLLGTKQWRTRPVTATLVGLSILAVFADFPPGRDYTAGSLLFSILGWGAVFLLAVATGYWLGRPRVPAGAS